MMMLRRLLCLIICFSALTSAHDSSTYEGLYFWGPEVHAFSPCGSDQDSWVQLSNEAMPVISFYQQQHRHPYQPMYLKFFGHPSHSLQGGFAESYQGVIYIKTLIDYSFTLPKHCQPAQTNPSEGQP